MNTNRKIFFLNGKRDHWDIGRRNAIWGLPIRGQNWFNAKARLQELGFIAGTEVLAVTGPHAHFRAVIGSDRGIYYDDASAPFGLGPRNDVYPVRLELTNIRDIRQDWFNGPRGDAWRGPLDDVYFLMRSLYVLPSQSIGDRYVNQTIILGDIQPIPDEEPPIPVPAFMPFEDETAITFSKIGFRTEQLGYKRPLERVPDGIGMLSRALVMYTKSLGISPYFVVWDCKYDCGFRGLKAEDERAIKEYIESYAPTRKVDAEAGKFWFLIITRTKEVADKIQNGVTQWAWPNECHTLGLQGIRVMSLATLERFAKKTIEYRQSGHDSDDFLANILPSEFAKPYLG